jgi:hypothetical protein
MHQHKAKAQGKGAYATLHPWPRMAHNRVRIRFNASQWQTLQCSGMEDRTHHNQS